MFKSMASPAPRECNQPARSALHRKQSAHRAAQRSALHRSQLAAHRPAHRIPCSAAHCIATSSQRIGPRISSRMGVYRFSSLVKQKIKGKNYAVFCFAGNRFFFYL
jgi:hypothetical protein